MHLSLVDDTEQGIKVTGSPLIEAGYMHFFAELDDGRKASLKVSNHQINDPDFDLEGHVVKELTQLLKL